MVGITMRPQQQVTGGVNQRTTRLSQAAGWHDSHSGNVVELPVVSTRADKKLHTIEVQRCPVRLLGRATFWVLIPQVVHDFSTQRVLPTGNSAPG